VLQDGGSPLEAEFAATIAASGELGKLDEQQEQAGGEVARTDAAALADKVVGALGVGKDTLVAVAAESAAAQVLVNSRTHVPQKLTGLISLTNPVSILSVPIQTVR
jgi:hypothetical protein